MRHLSAIAGAVILAAAGFLILWLSRAATTVAIVTGAGCIVAALVLAIPAQMQAAAAVVRPYLPLVLPKRGDCAGKEDA